VNSPLDQAVILEELRTTTREGGEHDGPGGVRFHVIEEPGGCRRAPAIKYDLTANSPEVEAM
jgi:hypothetical protein